MELLKYNVFLLKLTGLWSGKCNSVIKIFRRDLFFVFIIYPIFYFGSVGFTILQILDSNKYNLILPGIMSFIKGVDIVTTLALFYQRKFEIMDLRNQLEELDTYFECPDLIKVEKRIRKYTVIIMLYGVLFGTPFVIVPMLHTSTCKRERDIVLQNSIWPCGFYTPMWYPFPYYEGLYYYIILFVITCHFISFLFFGFGIRTYMFALVEHTVRHLKNMKRVLKISIDSQGATIPFSRCVQYHISIVKFFNNVDSCYSLITLAYIATVSTIIGIAEYELAMKLTVAGLAQHLPEIIAWTFMLFLLSYVPQRLWNESLTLSNHLYDCNWEYCPIRMQKDISFMLLKMQKPLCLSAGPLGYLGFENFYHILSNAYSFFAILITQSKHSEDSEQM